MSGRPPFTLPWPGGPGGPSTDMLFFWKRSLEAKLQEHEGRLREKESDMRFIRYGSSEGKTSGTTRVTMVPAPAAGILRKVVGVYIFNEDTASATFILVKKRASTDYRLVEDTLTTDSEYERTADKSVILDATNESLGVELGGTVTTNELPWNVVWEDYQM